MAHLSQFVSAQPNSNVDQAKWIQTMNPMNESNSTIQPLFGMNPNNGLCLLEHSMAETLTVAMRVAEEAIDEAISKAEFHTDNQVIYCMITI